MERRLCISVISCIMFVVGYGQTMTLKDCISTGILNNLSLENTRIDIDKSKTNVSQNRSRLLPVITGIFQYTDYLKSPVNVTTGTLLGNDFPEDPTWQTIKSMQYNASAGIGLSMPIYNQTIFAAIDVARTIENIKSLSYEKAVEDLTVQISKVYYMAQASLEQSRLTSKNVARMKDLYAITEALYRQGVVMEVDLNRVGINLQALEAEHDQYNMLYEQQKNMLRFLLNINPETPLEVVRMTENIEQIHTSSEVSSELPELQLTKKQMELAEKRIKSIRTGYLPTLSLTGYAGGLGYHEKLNRFTDNWFGNCYIAVSLKIPIFEANSKRLQIRQYKHDVQQASNSIELMQKQLNENYANAILQLNHNIEIFRTQSESRRQAENVYNVTEEQYKEGIASMTALLQDEMQLRAAEGACVQAHCQYNLARLDILKLSGNLSQLSSQQ